MYGLFILATSIKQQLDDVKAFKANNTQLTLVKYVYVDPGDAQHKYFYSPFIIYVDNFMQSVYSGENNLSYNIATLFEGSLSYIGRFYAYVIIPFSTYQYLLSEAIAECYDAPLCNRFTLNSEAESTQCYRFKVTNDTTSFPITYVSSPLYNIFSHSGVDGYFLQAGTLSFTIAMNKGKLAVNTTEFVCRGPPSITAEQLAVEDFVHGNILLDLRTLCVNNCIEYPGGAKLYGYRIEYESTSAALRYIRDIQFYFAWSGSLADDSKCRSERDAWYYYLRFYPSQSFVDAVVDYWGYVDVSSE